MDQPLAVAFTAFANVWPRANSIGIGAALNAIGVGRTGLRQRLMLNTSEAKESFATLKQSFVTVF